MRVHSLPAFPERALDVHKSSFKTVTVIGGCATMIGAPCFVAAGALRIGTGRLRLVVPAAILPTCLTLVPSVIGCPSGKTTVPEDVVADVHSIVVAGPGMGTIPARSQVIARLIAGRHTLILDGDALTHVARQHAPWRRREAPLVLTPHPGEYERLAARWGTPPLKPKASHNERRLAARQLAQASGAIVVLKGHRTVVSDGQFDWFCRTGNPALAIPGSGDVLAGVIAGLISQGMAPYPASCLGAHLHGIAGDLWAARHPVGLMALELSALLPEAVRVHKKSRKARRSR